MSGLRILEAITPSRVGGAEVYVANLCQKFVRRGAEIRLFCPAGRPFASYAAGHGLECVTWRTHGKFDPLTLARLVRVTRREGTEVVHTHLSTASLLGAWAARLAGVPSVAHVHGLNTATCFRYSSVIIAVSEAVKKHLCAQGIPEARIRVVHNGVDMERFRPAPVEDAKPALRREAGTPVFGVFGRLSPEKGQRVALEALFLVLRSHPEARLVLVGDGASREDLVASAKALEIEAHVEFVGFARDIRPLMLACDAVLVPSLKEGFGLAAVEAMALARPVIASEVGGLMEIVLPNETGLLVSPNEPQALAQAMLRIIDDPAAADEMARRARGRAEQYFDFHTQAGRVLAILEGVSRSTSGT